MRAEIGDDVLREEGRSSALQEAELWLQDLLATGGKPVRQIMEAATEAGIAERTLRRARERICQRPRRLDNHWIWELAERKTTVPLATCDSLESLRPIRKLSLVCHLALAEGPS